MGEGEGDESGNYSRAADKLVFCRYGEAPLPAPSEAVDFNGGKCDKCKTQNKCHKQRARGEWRGLS